MKTSDNRPAIRFTGCTNAWHHCQFNDIVITHPTKQFIKEPSLDGTIEVIQQGNEPVVGYANGSPFEEYASVTVFGDHTVSIYKPKKPFFVATDGTKILSGNNIEGNFFYFLLERYKPIPEGYKRHFTILIEQECNFPKSDEQKHIAQYMLYLDDLIERNKRKYEKLVNLKKAMLDKMFPKNGELVPEVRFAGFSSNWERRKLGEMAQFNPKEVVPNEFEYVDLESVVGTEMLSHRRETKRSAPSRAQRVAHVGDLFYQTVRPYQKNNYLFEIADGDYVFSTGYAQMRPSVDGYFLLSVILHDKFVNAVLNMCIGTGYPAVNSKDLAKIELCAPTQLAEQQIIGRYFRMLDELTNLQQRKLAKLQKLKSAFLEKMFV